MRALALALALWWPTQHVARLPLVLPQSETSTVSDWERAYLMERTARIFWRQNADHGRSTSQMLSDRLRGCHDGFEMLSNEVRRAHDGPPKPPPPPDPWWGWPLVAVGIAGSFFAGFIVANAAAKRPEETPPK